MKIELRRVTIERPAEVKYVDFGKCEVRLKSFLDANGITRNYLSKCADIKYQTIDRYYKNEKTERVDLTLIAKMCFALNCQLNDILVYIPPQESGVVE